MYGLIKVRTEFRKINFKLEQKIGNNSVQKIEQQKIKWLNSHNLIIIIINMAIESKRQKKQRRKKRLISVEQKMNDRKLWRRI